MAAGGIQQSRRGWYYGWNIVGILIIAQMAANGLTFNSLSLFLSGWSEDLHAPVSELTLAIVAVMLVGAPVAPIVGALADRYPARRLFIIGLLGVASFFVAMSFVTRSWHVVVLYAMASPLIALCATTPANALIARWFTRRIGLALGLTAFGLGLGGVLLPPLIAALLPTLGWRLIWRGAGLLVVVFVIPLVAVMMRNEPTEREGLHYVAGGDSTGTGRPNVHAHHAGRSDGPGWLDVLSRRNFWLLVFIYLAIMGTGSGFHQNVGPFAVSHGMDAGTAALLLSVMSISHLVAALSLGLLTDRFGARLPLAGLALIVAVGLTILNLSSELPLVVFSAALIGFNTGVFTPVAAAISAEFGARGFGKAFGLLMFFLPLSAPLAFALAKTQETTGTYTPAMIGFIVLLAIAAILSLFLKNTSESDASSENIEAVI